MSLAATQLGAYLNSRRSVLERRRALWARLARRKRRGDYSAELGRRAFRPLVDDTARLYVRELAITEKWNRAFPQADRNEVARELERDFRARYRRGELDLLLPKAMRPKGRRAIGNPIRRGYSRAIIGENIRAQRHEGKPEAQAVAIALAAARESWESEHPGVPLPAGLREGPKKRAVKKRTTKKRAAKKRTTNKRTTKKRTTKKRTTKKRTTKKRTTHKRTSKKRAKRRTRR